MTFHAFQSICGVLSTVVALIAIAPYYRAVLVGKTKPHQWSWFVFTVMNGIVTLSQFLEGGRFSVLISFTFCLSSFGTFLLALKYGTRDTSSLDRFLFAFSLLTIVVWVVTKNNAAAIWLTVVIDVCATTMTVLKIRHDPQSEDPRPWMIATIAFVFSCLALTGTSVSVLYVRPIYGVLSDLVIVAAVFYWIRKKPQREPIEKTPLIPLIDGNAIPQLGIGTWRVDDADAEAAIRTAIEVGYRLIDAAKLYRNEAGVGRAIRDCNVDRNELFVTTKMWSDDAGYDSALRAFDRSMDLLGLDHLDLYLIHWPSGGVDIDSWRAFVRLQEEGRVRSIGVEVSPPRSSPR